MADKLDSQRATEYLLAPLATQSAHWLTRRQSKGKMGWLCCHLTRICVLRVRLLGMQICVHTYACRPCRTAARGAAKELPNERATLRPLMDWVFMRCVLHQPYRREVSTGTTPHGVRCYRGLWDKHAHTTSVEACLQSIALTQRALETRFGRGRKILSLHKRSSPPMPRETCILSR